MDSEAPTVGNWNNLSSFDSALCHQRRRKPWRFHQRRFMVSSNNTKYNANNNTTLNQGDYKRIISFVVLLSHKWLVDRQFVVFVRRNQGVGRFISGTIGICSQCMELNRVIKMGSSTPIMTVLLEAPSCPSDGPLTRTAPGNVGAGAEDVDELLPDAAELLCFPLLHTSDLADSCNEEMAAKTLCPSVVSNFLLLLCLFWLSLFFLWKQSTLQT